MNNAKLIQNTLEEEPKVDVLAVYRKRASELTDIIEALSNISQSNYWVVLRQHEFDGDLHNLTSQLEKEENATKIYRLQGEIKRLKKYDLVSLLNQRRIELQAIKEKL